MFEKEAEEYYDTTAPIISEISYLDFENGVKLAFKDGAEFGYNKANEWHFVKKGEYPKEFKDILICFLTEDDMKDCIRGWYEYDLDEDEHYFKTVNIFGTEIIKKPYAWKEIVLPKE